MKTRLAKSDGGTIGARACTSDHAKPARASTPTDADDHGTER